MAGLHIEQRGSGRDLVLLHGWGLHGGLWGGAADRLAEHHRLHIVDLPGHGLSAPLDGDYTLERVAAAVADRLPAGADWLGWSLGGMVALQAAVDGVDARRLILVGAGARFVRGDDWPDGLETVLLEQFAGSLADDYRATLNRFLAVQSQGSEQGRLELRTLRSALFAHGEPDQAALAGGLAILQSGDLRSRLHELTQPTLLLQGERDTLFTLAAARSTAALLPHDRLATIAGAGHAPFLSHPDAFIDAVEGFLNE